MEKVIDSIPAILSMEALFVELAEHLPEELFKKVVDAHIATKERLKLQIEITEFVTNKLIKL
jgi:hypothetical protein